MNIFSFLSTLCIFSFRQSFEDVSIVAIFGIAEVIVCVSGLWAEAGVVLEAELLQLSAMAEAPWKLRAPADAAILYVGQPLQEESKPCSVSYVILPT